MLIKKSGALSESQVTNETLFKSRRQFLVGSGVIAASSLLPSMTLASTAFNVQINSAPRQAVPAWLKAQIQAVKPIKKPSDFYPDDKVTPYDDITHHNNFYEFGTEKTDPVMLANVLHTDPWSVEITGEVEKPGKYTLEDLLKPHAIEERIYRLRCVEGWSMVIPWLGFPLSDLIKRFAPTSRAKFVEFTTVYKPTDMPGQRSYFSTIHWPYVEGLRMDEAMHPLTFMAVGLYGESLPPQNGAPFRLVVPWKYGFKSIKSIVKIRFTETQPVTAWQSIAPSEYGFYSNVNPAVDHPRWSQKTERRLPGSLFASNIVPTQPFNGYADQVAHLYTGMDLKKFF